MRRNVPSCLPNGFPKLIEHVFLGLDLATIPNTLKHRSIWVIAKLDSQPAILRVPRLKLVASGAWRHHQLPVTSSNMPFSSSRNSSMKTGPSVPDACSKKSAALQRSSQDIGSPLALEFW